MKHHSKKATLSIENGQNLTPLTLALLVTSLGAWIRILFNYSLLLSFLGSTIASLSNPLYVGVPTKLASVWFKPSSVFSSLTSENNRHHHRSLCEYDRRGHWSAHSCVDSEGQRPIPQVSNHSADDSGGFLRFSDASARSLSLPLQALSSAFSFRPPRERALLPVNETAPHRLQFRCSSLCFLLH